MDSRIYCISFSEIGMANPIPFAFATAVFIPITSHLRFRRGHPLFHGLMAASVCMSPDNCSISHEYSDHASILLLSPDIIQKVTVF